MNLCRTVLSIFVHITLVSRNQTQGQENKILVHLILRNELVRTRVKEMLSKTKFFNVIENNVSS